MTQTPNTVPESFPSPNEYVDRAMELLTAEEYKVLSFAVRHILGWQDRRDAWEGTISYDMLEKGYTTKDGKHYGGTGLARNVLKDVLDTLHGFNLLVRGKRSADGQAYKLSREPDWAKMETRKVERLEANRQRTTKARSLRPEKKAKPDDALVSETNYSRSQIGAENGVDDYEKVSPTNQSKLVPLTGDSKSDYPKQSYIQSHTQSNQEQKQEPVPPQSGVKKRAKPGPKREPTEWQQIVGLCMNVWKCERGQATRYAQVLTGQAKGGLWEASNLTPPATLREFKGWWRWICQSHQKLPATAPWLQESFTAFRKNMAYEDAIRDANEPPPPPQLEIVKPDLEKAKWAREQINALAAKMSQPVGKRGDDVNAAV